MIKALQRVKTGLSQQEAVKHVAKSRGLRVNQINVIKYQNNIVVFSMKNGKTAPAIKKAA